METASLKLILSDPVVPVPDTGYFAGYSSGASESTMMVVIIITLVLSLFGLGMIIYRLRSHKKVGFLASFFIFGVLVGTIGGINGKGLAADNYATIEVQDVEMKGEISATTFTSGKITVTMPEVTDWGYDVYILGEENLDFIPETEGNETKIKSITENGALLANTYGFTLEADAKAEDEVWHPLSSLAELVASYDSETIANNKTEVYFGVLTNDEVSADTYMLDVNFYATLAPEPTAFEKAFLRNGIAKYEQTDYFAIQSMTPNVCGAVPTPTADEADAPSIQLIDTRDGKIYWVAKLADGECWMTQNLDLDLKSDVALTSKDTDLNMMGDREDTPWIYNDGYTRVGDLIMWTPKFSTTKTTWWPAAQDPRSVDSGDKYYYTSGTTAKDTIYESLDDCVVDHTESDCLHYSAGNRYNWTAAIASNNSANIDGSEMLTSYYADNSICPAGWRLPYGPWVGLPPYYDPIDYSEFNNLLYTYGVTSSLTSNGGSDTNYLNGGYIKIRTTPLYFVRGGYVKKDGSAPGFTNVGERGNYWINAVYSASDARYLTFYNSALSAVAHNSRMYGMAIRCVARSGRVLNGRSL